MNTIELYAFGDRLATFLRKHLKMLSHFDMRVLIFDINQSHFIRIGIFVSADLRFNSNEKPVVKNLFEDPRVIFMSELTGIRIPGHTIHTTIIISS